MTHESWVMSHHHKYSSSTISERKKSNEINDKLSDHFACIRTCCSGTIFEKTNFWRYILIQNHWAIHNGLLERQIIEMCDIFYLDKLFFEPIVQVSPDPNLTENRKFRKREKWACWFYSKLRSVLTCTRYSVPGHLVKVSLVIQNRKARFSNDWLGVESYHNFCQISPRAVKKVKVFGIQIL